MKRIFKIFNFGVFDYKDAEELINNMALKGYEFKGTGKGYIKDLAMFERNEKAKQYKYTIDVRCSMTEGEQERYYEFYKGVGWEKIDCFRKKLHIFRAQNNNAFPLYMDEIEELQNLQKAIEDDAQAIKYSLATIPFALIAGVLIYMSSIGVPFNRWVSYMGIVLMLLFVVYLLLEIIADVSFSVQCKKCIKTGKGYPDCRPIQELRWWENVFNVVALLLVWLGTVVGYSYQIWWNDYNDASGFGAIWKMILLSTSIISLPMLLGFTYLLFLYPKKNNIKMLNYVGYFLWFMSFYIYLKTYSTR